MKNLFTILILLLVTISKGQEITYVSTFIEFPRFKNIYLLNGNEIDAQTYQNILGENDVTEKIRRGKNIATIFSVGGGLLVGAGFVDIIKYPSRRTLRDQTLIGLGITSYLLGNLEILHVSRMVAKQRDAHNRQFFGTEDKYLSYKAGFSTKFTINGVPISDKKLKLLLSSEDQDQYFENFLKQKKVFRTVLYPTLVASTGLLILGFTDNYRHSVPLAYTTLAVNYIGFYYTLKWGAKMEESRTKFMDRINLSQIY